MIINEFKNFCLKKNYIYIYILLNKYQNHIFDIYKRYIINTTDKNIYINQIYELAKDINNNYNNLILKYSDIDKNNLYEDYLLKYKDNYNDLYELIETKYFKENLKSPIPYDILYPLNIYLKESILSLSEKIGFPSLIDLFIYNNLNIKCNDIILKHFKILKVISIKNVTLTKLDKDNIKFSDKLMNPNFFFRINNLNNNIVVTCYDLYINKKYKIEGIFHDDYLNLSSRIMTQISFPEIFLKKKEIAQKINNFSEDEFNFKNKYLKYCDIGEIIVNSNKEWIKILDNAYKFYKKLCSKTFTSIMQEFSNKNNKPTHLFNMIKYLLLGTEDQVNIGGMLFLILKDKKINNLYISDIIYFGLNFVSQIKLKKININLKEELEKINEITYENVDLKKQILLLKNMPLYVKTLCIEKINEMKLNNNDYYKQLLYVKTLLNFPWPEKDEQIFKIQSNDHLVCADFFKNIESKLNLYTFGHTKIKEQLILQIAKWVSNPKSNGCALALNGPPGVGKTLIAKSLSDALDIPFIQITLGGQNDGELLHGHGYTYSGSQPGLIIKKIIEAGTTRCILYLDELDKSCAKHGSINEITSILIHLTDTNINSSFQDRFFQGIDFPLDKVIIMTSYNDRNKIDPILLDRFIEFDVKPYNIKDKILIIKNYIIKELKEKIGFTYDIEISDKDIENIINDYTIEAGVRDIKRKFELIILKLNKLKLTNELDKYLTNNKIYLTQDIIENILDISSKIEIKKINDLSMVGVINGLYATNIGTGGITVIQIDKQFSTDNNFSFKFTGSQGKIMQESVQCAFTCALRYLHDNVNKDILKNIKKNFINGFHIHTPSTGTAKDGPSAGCAFAIGFISLILNKPFNNKVAITGEIDLNSNITKIGGLEYKLIGAKNAGINLVLIPDENKNDIDEIKKNYINLFDDTFNYILVKNLSDVIKYCF